MGEKRVDASKKITGRARYVDDLSFPEMLHGCLKRSPYPHARIKSIDTSSAAIMEGVFGVLTGKDLPKTYGVLPVTQDETALSADKVRYVGEPVAAVCATDYATARRACEEIEVTYEKLEPVLTLEDASQAKSRVHNSDKFVGNAHREVVLEFGNVEEAFDHCDHVRTDLYRYPGNTHLPMEPHSTVARYEEDRVLLYVSHQAPSNIERIIPEVLGIADDRLTVRVPYVGGGFGGKLDLFPETVCAAKLAMKTGSPVKFTLTREEVFYNHRGRHPVRMQIRTGMTGAKIHAMHIRHFLDGGAYGSYGVATTYYQGTHQTVTYRIPNYRVEAVRFYTNKPPCGPKRGHGTPQPRFALERHLDHLAEDIQSDPVQIRKRNSTEPDSVTANKLQIGSSGLERCLDRVLKESNFKSRYGNLPDGRGIGLSISSYLSGASLPVSWNQMPHSEVRLEAHRNGKISVFSGHTEIGQGSDHMLASLVSNRLGLEPEDIHLVLRDSDITPHDLGSYSSRVTMMVGNAAIEVTESLKVILRKTAAEILETRESSVLFRDGRILDKVHPERDVSLKKVIRKAKETHGALSFSGTYKPPEILGDYKGAGVGPSPAHSFTACAVEVSVDKSTGIVIPEELWIAHDIGSCIHRTSVEGQVEGGVYMGLCEVLMETNDLRSSGGRIPNTGFLDYKTLTFREMPELHIYLVKTEDREGPDGAKEVGQGPLLPVIPATVNAVYDATGIRFDTFPLTPDRVFEAIERNKSRVGPEKEIEHNFSDPIMVEVPEDIKEHLEE